MTSWEIPTNTATVVTLIAGLATFVSALSYFLTRPRPRLRVEESGAVELANDGTSRAIRNLRLGWANLDSQGHATGGSGADPWGPDLTPKARRLLWLLPARSGPADDPDFGYVNLLGLRGDEGIVLEFYWQAPLIPWAIKRTVVLWTHEDRIRERKPRVITGRAGRREWEARVPEPA